MKKTIILLSIVLLLLSCKKDNTDAYVAVQTNNIDILFEFRYVNNAWGSQQYGWILAADGSIWAYQNPANISTTNAMDLPAIDSICANTKPVVLSNPEILREIDHYKALSTALTNPNYSEGTNSGADMGQSSYYCYQNTGNNKYKQVLLQTTGDWEQHIISPEAQEIVKWLKKINLMLNNVTAENKCDSLKLWLINEDRISLHTFINSYTSNLYPVYTNNDIWGHENNIKTLINSLNSICSGISVSLNCYACIKTYPPESEIVFNFIHNNKTYKKVIDLGISAENKLYFGGIHDYY